MRGLGPCLLVPVLLAAMPAFAADLQVTDFSDTGYDPSPAGAELTYSITVENGAADTVTNAVMVIDLPAGATAGTLAPFCAADAGVPTRVVCNIGTLVGTLGPGGSPVVFPLGVHTGGMAPGIVTVSGAIGFGDAVPPATTPVGSLVDADPFFGADTNKPNNRRQETTTLVDAGNLRLEKSASPAPVVGGAVVTYTLTVTNQGPSTATNFTVTDTLPAATSYIAGSFSGAGWTFNGGSMTATHAGSLAVGDSTGFSFQARVEAGSGNIVNSAVATAIGTPDPDTDDNTAQVTTAVTPGADLTVGKSATPAPAISGQPMTFTLLARNLGPSAAENVSLVDTMPAGFVITGGTQPAGWTCVDDPGATERTCTRAAPMPPGAAETITIEALVPANGPNSSGDVTNSATIASDTPDPNGPLLGIDNNTGSSTFTVLSDGADLAIAKQKAPPLVPVWDGIGSDADSLMTSTIEVANLGPRRATGQVQVVDHLAEGEEFISSSGPWSCVVDSPYAAPPARQRVTCDLSAAALPLDVGADAPDLVIVTRAMAAGSLTNSACTGGSNGTFEPLTDGGIDLDPYTDNDCSGSGTRTTNERADLRISKQTNGPGDADNILDASEDTLTYTITVTNDGPDATAGIVVNDTIPGFVGGRTTVAATSVPAGWTCSTSNTVVCRSGTTTLANGASATIELTVTRALYDSAGLGATTCGGVPISNAYCNTAGVGIDASVPGSVGEIEQGNNSASDWVQVDRVANVRTTAKSITSGSPGQAGVETTYVMSFANEGPSAVPGVVFVDTFQVPANDAGFVLVSATRTGGGTAACPATPGPGLVATPAAGGTSYANPTGAPVPLEIRCAPLGMANGQTEALTVVIRPNVNVGNTGRTFDNTAGFHFDRDGDGTPDAASGVDAAGTFDFNLDASTADDERSATLPFESGEVDLIVNKVDTGFSGGVDPLGYDELDPSSNLITYRVTVRNNGPSLATDVRIDDVITPPAGRTVSFVGASETPGGVFGGGYCTVAGGTNPVIGPASLQLECQMPGAGFSPNQPGVVRSQNTSTLYLRYLYQTPPAAAGDTLENSVAASSAETETNSGNNSATQETTIRTRADMAVSKSAVVPVPASDPSVALPAPATSVTLRQPFHYVIEAENLGPGASLSLDRSGSSPLDGSGTRITDTLPSGLVVTGPITWQKVGPSPGGDEVPNGTGTCTRAGVNVTCEVGDVTVTGRVRVIVPARWDSYPSGGTANNTATVSTEQVDAVPGNNTTTVPLQVTRSSLAGTVFEDRDRAGGNGGIRQAPAEPGIAGVTVTLTGTDLYGNAVNRTATTNASGNYSFNNLSPSDAAGYTITQSQPAGYVNGPVDPPLAGGSAPSLGGSFAAGAPDSAWSAIAVGGSDSGVRYNFPEVRRPSLSGHVYVDGNYNDARDTGEAPIAGAAVELLDAATGVVLQSTITDAAGAYRFDDLDPLVSYTLREPLPAGNYQNRPGAIGPGEIGGAPCTIGCTPGTGIAGDSATTDRISDISLAAGLDGTAFDFGEDAIAAISGTVYLDRNRNGGFDAGDTGSLHSAPNGGIAGVTVGLQGAGPDGSFGTADDPVIADTTTAADGSYSFAALVAGQAYRIVQVQPAGYGNGSEAGTNQIDIASLPVAGSSGHDFGETVGSIAGFVFEDFSANAATNNNGQFDAGENPIDNATVTLTGTDAAGNPVNVSVQTDAAGAFLFDDLLSPQGGTGYTITETQPAGYIDGRHTAGNATVPGSTATPNVIDGIAIDPGQEATGYLFGELANATISGTVYLDRDDDGTQGPGDPGIPDVTVTIEGAGIDGVFGTGDDPAPAVLTTDADGQYAYTDAVAGQDYRIVETQPAGHADGQENTGNQIDIVNLPAAGSAGNDFGELLGSLSGFVFEDFSGNAATNNNGQFDAGENPIANVTVTLTGTDAAGDPVNVSVQTDVAGAYRFDDLLSPLGGTAYTVTETQPAGYIDGRHTAGNATVPGNTTTANVIDGIAIAPGEHATGYQFGELANATINGTVYLDRDDDGTQGPGDPGIADVTVTIEGAGIDGAFGTGDDPAPVVLVTDADGNYSHGGAVTGQDYRIIETQPAGHADGQENTGNQIDVVNLPAAGSSGNDFGELLGSLSGFVFEDFSATAATNNNGQFDPGENPIGNATVTLTGTDAAGNPVNVSVQTNAAGAYRFDALLSPLAGTTYTITETQPGGYIDGQHTAGNATVSGSTATPNVIDGIAIVPGEHAAGYLFGELANATISGSVYLDRNDDGLRDPGDRGIGGVTITIEGAGLDGVFGTGDDPGPALLATDADGNYSYGGAVAGQDYRIVETQPAGHAEGQENASNQIDVVNLPAAGSAGNDFGELLGSLSGFVFEDFSATAATNNNGQFDAGENPIANVTVTLTGTDAAGDPVNVSVQTDATGAYRFDELLSPQGGTTYTVTETQPAGYADGRHSAGNATVPGTTSVPNEIAGIAIDPGEHATGYLFGELVNAGISGTVYLDRDDDGSQGPGDPGIPNVTVTIEGAGIDGIFGNADDPAPVVLTTDADGNYSHDDAVAGQDYRIVETQPAGLADGQENTANQVDIANLPVGGTTDIDFGELAASLSGSVWLDADNDGVRDPGEPGIPGVVVSLPAGVVDALGNPVGSATTDAAGDYRFDDLPAGTYTVTQQAAQPVVGGVPTLNGTTIAGTVGGVGSGTATPVATVPSAIAGIVLPAGGASVDNDFGETFGTSVSGRVFLDGDNDGVQSGPQETGIPGVVIELTGVDDTGAPVSLDTTTDAAGDFAFEGLRPGSYTLTEPTQPDDTSNGQTVAGSAGGTATPISTVPSVISAIDLSVPGTDSTGNLFAEIPLNSAISGRVWLDLDNDGSIDPDEEGIAGVLVELSGTDLAGNSVSRQATTGADGSYVFGSLPPGNYTVTEPVQPDGTLDGITVAGTGGGTASAPGDAPSSIAGITLGVADNATGNDFGEIPSASISGLVYNDPNNNGVVEDGEAGYAGVRLVLTGTDELGNAVDVETTTDADGRYRFEGLRPGSYTVTEPEQPPQTLNGITTAGTIDGTPSGTATPVATTPSAISGIALPPGAASVDNDFAEIGDSPDLVVSKAATPATFTVNNTGRYTITIRNIGQQPTSGAYTVRDRLPAGLTLAATPSGEGWTCTGAAGEGGFACTASAAIAAGATGAATIVADVDVDASAATGSPVDNAVLVEGGGEYAYRAPTTDERSAFEGTVSDLPVCDPAITQNACRLPTPVQLAASVSGTVWFDQGADPGLLDGGDSRLGGWIVEVVDADGAVVDTATTTADGRYEVLDLVPGVPLDIRFREPDSGIVWGLPVSGETASGPPAPCDEATAIADGTASSCRVRTDGSTRLAVVLEAGTDLPEQSLPLNPGGVVYDATTRSPVPGSRVVLAPVGTCPGYSPEQHILNAALGGYSIDGDAVSMTVGRDGFYQFLLAPEAPASCRFALTVVPPAGYSFASSMIPAEDSALTPPSSPGEAFRVQDNATAPTGPAGTATTYYLELALGSGLALPVHNHIPLDPQVAPGLVILKTGDRKTVEVGDSMVYSITIRQTAGAALGTVNVVDRLPHGFTYIEGTARLDGSGIADPLGKPGPLLVFDTGAFDVGAQKILSYRVRVGVGSQQGDGINRAQAYGCSIAGGCVDPATLAPYPGGGVMASNKAEYRVIVSGGVFAEEGCVLGKIFVDCNVNHVQDAEELGIPGVRMYFEDGTWLVSDSEGKYSYCGLPPTSHTLKVDGSTLPVGSRLVTSSNRNLGDADSLFIDLKNGELHRADFIEGSCSNPVLEQVKARRTQGEVRAPETETGQAALRFESKPRDMPEQGTDSARQLPIVDPRPVPPGPGTAPEGQP